ncbi:unnamed protein product [Thelazia callipaeda]|uniref:Transmembrane protein n=1 Tax=Thelazia callipaeda TaxID=103827 RepID=A0A158RD33_THECL|nr:unnamed protein product [Thelazia callipaeda]
MLRWISLGVLLLLLSNTHSQEECFSNCTKTHILTGKSQDACKEGCRLQIIFAFTLPCNIASTKQACYNGCVRLYTDSINRQACSFGCDNQQDLRNSRLCISITNQNPTYDVVREAVNKMMHRVKDSLPLFSFEDFGLQSSGRREEHLWENLFSQWQLRVQNEIARFHQIAQNVLNLQRARTIIPVVASSRPHGHERKALEGPNVGNSDDNGEQIIQVQPVESKNGAQQILREMENPTIVEVTQPPLLSRLASRARRLSVLSQWLVCVALFLCLVSMLSISVAILKQIRSQRYLNLRNMHAVVPTSFTESHLAKKVPLKSVAVAVDYPLVHDSPPPAYDQLSVHRMNHEDGENNAEPKV